jgi:hypothetical protein
VSFDLRRSIGILLHVDDSPHRVALAFGVGVFIAFSPLLGIHTGLALAVAFAFRLSRVAILAGTWTNNPWTLVPMYMSGTASLEEIDWALRGRAFYEALWTGLRPLLWPYVVGNTVLGTLAGIASYVALRTLLERRRRAPSPSEPS